LIDRRESDRLVYSYASLIENWFLSKSYRRMVL
jgi:hypothetical protein